MTFFLKVMHNRDNSPVASDNEHSIHGDLTSVSFTRYEDGRGQALCYVRDSVKTASVPGFVEHETIIDIPADAYVMNADGKTVSSFSARRSGGDPQGPDDRPKVR